MSPPDRLLLLGAATVALACSALGPLYLDRGWLIPVLGVIAALTASTMVSRRVRLPRALEPVVSLAAGGYLLCPVFAPASLRGGVLPTGATWTALAELLRSGRSDARRLTAPVPSSPGLVLLAVLAVGAVTVLVHLSTVTAGRPALAGAPLLLLVAAAAGLRRGGVGTLPFALTAAGWLALLAAEGGRHLGGWGAAVRVPAPGQDQTRPVRGRLGGRIGAAALGLALLAPATLPGLDGRRLGANTDLGGAGRTGQQSTTYNPLTELRGELVQPTPTELFRYITTETHPDYLRLTTLDTFTGQGWSASPLRADLDRNAVQQFIPRPATLNLNNTVTVRDNIAILALTTKWLPVPFPPTQVTVAGPWVWDRASETVFSALQNTGYLQTPYEVTATRVAITPGLLTNVGRRPPELARFAQPVTLTPYVRREVQQAVSGAGNDFGRVLALQQYFLNPRRFAYSTDADAPGSPVGDPLERFLRSGRGFCEQYASAMAAMVRSLGIPARVAVGFTPGSRDDAGTFVVTTSDAHAWPEVWFAGSGWLRFEPTPRPSVTSIPGYAFPLAGAPGPVLPGDDPAGGNLATDTARHGKNLDAALEPRGQGGVTAPAPPVPGTRQAGWPFATAGGLALLLAAAGLPALLRAARRRGRLRHPTAESTWAALQDDAADLGHRWRPSETPRAAAARLAARHRLAGPAAAALGALVAATEQSRYARGPGAGHDPRLAEELRLVAAALRRDAGPLRRLRATMLPPSSLAWLRSTAGGTVADLLDLVEGALDQVGRGLRRPVRHR